MAKIKVSQATIDNIKKMGMTKALAGASKANPEMKEALTRMYGARRVSAAGGSSPVAAKSADAARSGAMKKTASVYKSADAARASASKTTKTVAKSADAARMSAQKKTTAKTTTKKSTKTTDPFAKFVFGVGRASAEPFKSKK